MNWKTSQKRFYSFNYKHLDPEVYSQKNVHADSETLNPTTAQYNTYPVSNAPSFCIGLGKLDVLADTSSVLGRLSEGEISKLSLVMAWATKSGNKWGNRQSAMKNSLKMHAKEEICVLREKNHVFMKIKILQIMCTLPLQD